MLIKHKAGHYVCYILQTDINGEADTSCSLS